MLQIGKAKVPVADESVDTTGCIDNDVSERVFIGKKLDVRLDRCPTTVYLEVSGECDVLALLVFDSGTAVIGVGKGVLSSVQTADRVNCIPQRLPMLEVGWRSDLRELVARLVLCPCPFLRRRHKREFADVLEFLGRRKTRH